MGNILRRPQNSSLSCAIGRPRDVQIRIPDSGFGRVFFGKMFFQPISGVLIDAEHMGSFLHGIMKLELGADQLVRFRWFGQMGNAVMPGERRERRPRLASEIHRRHRATAELRLVEV